MAKSTLQTIAGKVEQAKKTFRGGEDFYNAETGANKILEQALAIISIAHFPTQINLNTLEFPSFRGRIKVIQGLAINTDQNPFADLFQEHFVSSILKESADLIGISITGYSQLVAALTLSRLIKAASPKTHVAIGGNIVSLLADSIKKYPELFGKFFDTAIVYEGEKPMAALAEHLRDGLPPDTVPNLIWYDGNKVRSNEVAAAETINSLPTPSLTGCQFDLYLSPEPVLSAVSVTRMLLDQVRILLPEFRLRGVLPQPRPQKVLEDMQELSMKHGTKYFAFSDEAISPNMIGSYPMES